MHIVKPLLFLVSVAAILATVSLIATSSNAQSNSTRQPRNQQQQQQQQQQSTRTALEYATLSSQRVEQNGRTTYQVVWEFGDFTLDGQSSRSIEDAYRELTGKFGGGVFSVSNLSTLLTRIGTQGWELIESSGEGSATMRIFKRRTF